MRHTTPVFFNGQDLNSLEGVQIVNYDVSELPTRILTANKLARANKSILTSAEYSEKTVTVTGYVGGDGINEVQYNYDMLKAKVQWFEGVIKVQQGDLEVEYTCTLNAISKEMVGPNYKFTLEFRCSNPIGRDAPGRALFPTQTITSATATITFDVEGSFTATPRFNIVVNSVDDGSPSKSITLLNAADNKGIRITRDWADGDILTVDSSTMDVTVNSVMVDFEGQFPVFMTGVRTLQYIDDFTSRDISISATYARQYI